MQKVEICEIHGLEAIYTQKRCVACMDAIPLNKLGAPDFTKAIDV